jgi:hypothetical protein
VDRLKGGPPRSESGFLIQNSDEFSSFASS